MRRLPDPRDKPWLTVAELAAISGEGEKVIRAALDAGQLPLLQIGRYVRIPTAELLRRLGISDDSERAEAAPARATTAELHALTKKTTGGSQHGVHAS